MAYDRKPYLDRLLQDEDPCLKYRLCNFDGARVDLEYRVYYSRTDCRETTPAMRS